MMGRGHDGLLTTLIRTCHLCEPLRAHRLSEKPPSTYNWGQHRIDFIFTTTKVIEVTLQSGLFPYDSVFLSDHRACYIDINSLTLFQESTPAISPPQYRGIRIQDPRVVSKYIDILENTFFTTGLIPK